MLEKLIDASFFTHVINFSGQTCFLSVSQFSFAPEQRSTLSTFNTLINNSVLFQPLVSSFKDKNFQSTSVFYQIVLKTSFKYYNAYKLVPFYEKPSWGAFYSNFINY